MLAARGLVIAFVLFALSFALHIVGGATDQGWLFAVAVALIYVTATGYPAIAVIAAGPRARRWERQATIAIGAVIGLVLTIAALWAANGRAFAWWQFPLAPVLVTASSVVIWRLSRPWSGAKIRTLSASR